MLPSSLPNLDVSIQTSDVPTMPLNLLDLPLVLVQDVLEYLVNGYTIKRTLRLELLLNIRLVNSVFPLRSP
jgi:hypothetical protein